MILVCIAKIFDGSFNFRFTIGTDCYGKLKNYLSPHSYGIALDINAGKNPLKLCSTGKCGCNKNHELLVTNIPNCMINSFKKYGFYWGGDFLDASDAMHFEFRGYDKNGYKYITEY